MNVRDLGGLPTADGRRTRWGAVVRSDNPARLTAEGWRSLRSHGVRTIVALRTVGGRDNEPAPPSIPADVVLTRVFLEDLTDPDFHHRWITNGLWGTPLYFGDALRRWPARAAEAVSSVARAGPGGVVVSCGRGCDRTGFVTMLVLHLVGVPLDQIVEDYAASIGPTSVVEPGYGEVLLGILEEHGTSMAAVIAEALDCDVAATLCGAGLPAADLERLSARLVEP